MSLNNAEAPPEETEPAAQKMKINTKKKNPQIMKEIIMVADIKRNPSLSLLGGSPRSPKGLAKSTSARCLCSPTTHAGSFRCRHHRNNLGGGLGSGGMMSRPASVGSNLSLLGPKSPPVVGESKMNNCVSKLF